MDRIKTTQTREELYLSIPKGGVGAELGVCKGSNAAILFQYTKPTKMYLVDIWTELCPDGIHSLYRATEIIMIWFRISSQKKFLQEELK